MQRIDGVLTWITAVRAFFAGAAILAGAAAPDAQAHDALNHAQRDVALAVPRVPSLAQGPVALPQPLPPSEAQRIRHILDLRRTGAASSEGVWPADGPLAGPVEADRLLHLGAAAGAEQLRAWLAHYSDLPDAAAIHTLLLTKLPRGAVPPTAPPPVATLPPGAAVTAPDDVDLTHRIQRAEVHSAS